MTDAFALLGLPRRAALDEAQLQAAWHEKSRAAHPDTAGGDAALAADINAAHEILASPETSTSASRAIARDAPVSACVNRSKH